MIKTNILVLCLMLLIGCATLPNSPATTPDGIVYTPQMVADEVGSRNYDALCTWIHTHLTYRSDRTAADEWKEPEVTLADGTGDCEDLAQVSLEVMRLWGVKDAYLMGVSNVTRNNGHVVSFFRDKPTDDWRIFSNDDAKLHSGGRTLNDVMHSVGSMMRYGSNLEYLLANNRNENIPPEAREEYGLV